MTRDPATLEDGRSDLRRAPAVGGAYDRQVAETPGGRRKWLGKGAIPLSVCFGLAVLSFRFVAFEPFRIPSGSMSPTLLVGDYLFVSKYSYGYGRYSFPLGLVDFEGRIWESPVERGDVAVFRKPGDTRIDYIKRIVGLPGDRIQVRQGILHINGAPVERERIEDYALARDRIVPQYLETLPNGRTYRVIEEFGDVSSSDDTREFTVPVGHYFALGDNWDNSMDSRLIGAVPAENFIGRAGFLFFSRNGESGPGESVIRFDRIFDGVE